MLREEFGFVEPRVHAVLGQAGVKSAHGVTVRVGVAEEDFERAFGFEHFGFPIRVIAEIIQLKRIVTLFRGAFIHAFAHLVLYQLQDWLILQNKGFIKGLYNTSSKNDWPNDVTTKVTIATKKVTIQNFSVFDLFSSAYNLINSSFTP